MAMGRRNAPREGWRYVWVRPGGRFTKRPYKIRVGRTVVAAASTSNNPDGSEPVLMLNY